jgi:DNA polymerase I-like protein with 3'-5' exonuclease and polymerase domains
MSQHTHWFPQLVQKIKHQTDLAEKFLLGYICRYSHNGRIHATVNQFRNETGGARSHRFSYADPPLQQMPSRDEEFAALIRSCFLPEDGEMWCSVDYRQQEYRLIVFVAEVLKARGAKEAADMYRNNPETDFHQYVADITRLERRRAKDVNFAISYGAGVPKFALMTGMSIDESQATMDQYNEYLPFVREASDRYTRFAQQLGYIKLIDGSRGHFNLWEPTYRDYAKESTYKKLHTPASTIPCTLEEATRRLHDVGHPWFGERLKRAFAHKAFNRMIQGSAARQIKKAMALIYKEGYSPLIQLHDELGFSFINERDGRICAEIMEQACPIITIPMLTDVEWGSDWGYAKMTYENAKNSIKGLAIL